MGTPIRRLLQSKIVSPLSPTLYTKQVARRSCEDRSPTSQKLIRARNIGKSLNFQVPSWPKEYSPFRGNETALNSKINKESKIKIEVTDYSSGLLLLNTPNKNNLLENGLYCNRNLKILGQGSFGVVVPGIYKGAQVAVKIAKLCHNDSSSLKEENALHLNHENVVKVTDIIINENGNYGIVLMEYLKSSRHLQSILDDQKWPLNTQTIVKYASDICRGLRYCHERRVLHLDLKPSNVLVCEGQICKLCDFGNSVKLEDIDRQDSYHGTVAYAAPELLLGKSPTTACDVYSLGILLWQLRHREIPYSELEGAEVIIYKVVKFDFRPVPALDSIQTIQDDYQAIYSNCWAPDASSRPSITSIINMLSSL